jgi:hypothetical protein
MYVCELVKMIGVVDGVDQKTEKLWVVGEEVNLRRVRR